MNAERLLGTVLGTCTLQKLIGQGGMGAVFLAQQSRPKRQVAVKVLLPMIPLNHDQLAAFLERFRRETDAAAALEHPNIMPVHEYGEYGGLAYLVMPYISGGTLRDVLEREGPLPLAKVTNYLEQLAAAIDYAHDHGVIHRDIKPANIMVTPEGRLLLGDFGLVKIIAEGQSAMVRLTGAGAPVGTPDYMAPEQVIGDDVDTRADLYSLGILLFQLVTGTTPFRGETPMQIAAQHLRLPPPSPLILRPDLPIRADQVIKRAMAKKPSDRYTRAKDLANAFRQALLDAGIELEPSSINGLRTDATGAWRALPKRQFEPLRQTASPPKIGTIKGVQSKTVARLDAIPDTPAISEEFPPTTKSAGEGLSSRTGKSVRTTRGVMPAAKSPSDPTLSLDKTASGAMPAAKSPSDLILSLDETASGAMPAAKSPSDLILSLDETASGVMPAAKSPSDPTLSLDGTASKVVPAAKSPSDPTLSLDGTASKAVPAAKSPSDPTLSLDGTASKVMPAAKSPSDPTLSLDGNGGGLLSRTGKFPMIGTNSGILSVTLAKNTNDGPTLLSDKQPSIAPIPKKQSSDLPKTPSGTLEEPETQEKPTPKRKQRKNPAKSIQTATANQDSQSLREVLPVTPRPEDEKGIGQKTKIQKTLKLWMKALTVIATVLAIFAAVGILFTTRVKSPMPQPARPPDVAATATITTPQTNIILSDPLNRNTNGWNTNPANVYAFKDGAYHITDDNDQNGRASILSTKSFNSTVAYQLTMQEIAGNDTNPNNSFGMIFRFSQQNNKKNKNSKPIITFYSFEVVNIKGGEYYFWKYDNTNPDNPWTQIQDGKLPIGNEFHQGQGPQAVNTIKILMNHDKFTITVNGKVLPKTFQDASLTQGMVGMIVNLKGTEVAFSNLLITRS